MKVVILAGGLGTRMSEYTEAIPKPMVKIGNKPIIHHIMNYYASYGFKEFIICCGYKGEIIKNYFYNLFTFSSYMKMDFSSREFYTEENTVDGWKIELVDTGEFSMTGGRLTKVEHLVGDRFFLTYGDGLCDLDLDALLQAHVSSQLEVTVTAVTPPARFGRLLLNDSNEVLGFDEKPLIHTDRINGGFFVMEKAFLKRLVDEMTVLEKEPLKGCAEEGLLNAYVHDGFWQCMDTKRDVELLTKIWNAGHAPWSRL